MPDAEYYATQRGWKGFMTERLRNLVQDILSIEKDRQIKALKEIPKKDLLKMPFWIFGGLKEADSELFHNFHVMKYGNSLNLHVYENRVNDKKWAHTEEFPLQRFLRYDFKKLHAVIYGRESKYADPDKSYFRNALPMGSLSARRFRKFLKTLRGNLGKIGFSKKDGPFMSVDINSLKGGWKKPPFETFIGLWKQVS